MIVTIRLDLYHHFDPAPADPRMDQIIALVKTLNQHVEKHMSALDDAIADLTQKVTALTAVDESAVALIDGIAAQIEAAVQAAQSAGATTEQLQALNDLSAKLDSETTSMGRAVAANTPAPQPAPEPAPEQPANP